MVINFLRVLIHWPVLCIVLEVIGIHLEDAILTFTGNNQARQSITTDFEEGPDFANSLQDLSLTKPNDRDTFPKSSEEIPCTARVLGIPNKALPGVVLTVKPAIKILKLSLSHVEFQYLQINQQPDLMK